MHIALARLLNLKPLDRVQLNDRREINEMQFSVQLGYGQMDLPFLYFQRVCADGRLELASPSGYITYASPADICDVISGEQIKVRAMPHAVFKARMSLPLAQRQSDPADECYVPATVLRLEKDRWNRVDRVFVQFDDQSLNEDRAVSVPIHTDDLKLLASKARRVNLPVISPKARGYSSAEHGVATQRQKAWYAAQAFFKAALAGQQAKASAICGISISNLTTAQINRLPAHNVI